MVDTNRSEGASSDNAPIESFSHCHVGIISQLEQLGGLPALLEPARRARLVAQQALRFFKEVVHEHHADEERELFPAVLASAQKGQERDSVQQMVERLTQDHRRLEAAWAALEPAIKEVAKGHDASVDTQALTALVNQYQGHASHEESAFLPLAQTILGRNSNHMAALGLSLHLRRAVPEVLSRYGYRT